MADANDSGRGKNPGSVTTQFKKGAPSPNRKGRPRGSKNRNATIIKVLSEVVSADMGGKKRKISVTEASLRKLSQMALKGDRSAIGDIMRLWKEAEEGMLAAVEAEYPFNDRDREVIAEIQARMATCGRARVL